VNVVYVATTHDSVFAFNADTPGTGTPLWQAGFLNSGGGTTVTPEPVSALGCAAVNGYTEVGITGTPVIDSNTNTMYLVAKTMEVTNSVTSYVFRLHALDITTGAEKLGGPVVINASVGTVSLNTQSDLQRPALLEVNGTVYITFGSNGCDKLAHGWVLAYSASSLQQLGVFNSSPAKSYGSSIWMSGIGPASDSDGNIYLSTANGVFDVNTGGSDYGDTVMKLSFNGSSFSVSDYFTPFNQGMMNSGDLDLGSGGVVLLPDQISNPQHLLLAVGKTGTVYLINRDSMGHYTANGPDQVVAELVGAVKQMFGAPVYWNGNVYFATHQDYIKAYSFIGGVFSSTWVAESPASYTFIGVPVISANGGDGGDNGILWMVRNLTSSGNVMLLSAFDATNLTEIYNSNKMSSRDALGTAAHFVTPLIANGKVYVGTQTQLRVFGLFPEITPASGNNQTGAVGTQITMSAKALDPYSGHGIAGVAVGFVDGGKGGVFSPSSVTTDSNGIAATTYTLPQTAGTYTTIVASSAGYASANFIETAVPGPPASISLISGSSQSGTVGTTLPNPLIVKVKDSFGNNVPGSSVTYSDLGLQGSFSPNPATSGANGQASTVYTFGTTAHVGFAITASSGNATPATFRETSIAGPPTSVTTQGGNLQTGKVGTQLTKALIVLVKDQYGNKEPAGVSVTFSDGGVGGVLSNPNAVTNGAGQASTFYTLPGTPQTVTITATSNGHSVNFTETATQ
jgi:hypothetical protein